MTTWTEGLTAQQQGRPVSANPHQRRTDSWWTWRFSLMRSRKLLFAAPDYDAFVRGVTDDLGFAEWSTPQHAEEILAGLIKKWHAKGRAAIAKAEGRS